MRYVSENFKEKQDKIIRPPLDYMYLLLNPNYIYSLTAMGGSLNHISLDDTVAPVVAPKYCSLNVPFYAVLGEGVEIDNTRLMCAPDNSGTIAEPTHAVPYGITPYKNANERAMIGDDNVVGLNFIGIEAPIEFNFAGGHLPTRIDIEYYDETAGLWRTAIAYQDLDGFEHVTYTPPVYDKNKWYHFEIQATTPGRFQLSYIRSLTANLNGVGTNSFIKTQILKASITNETDLTSQNLPSYEMNVECLDINDDFRPGTKYWNSNFKEGMPVLFMVGDANDYTIEWLTLMIGVLKEEPNYSEGKITFKIATSWKNKKSVYIPPETDNTLSEGDTVEGHTFASIIATNNLFDDYDVFPDVSDRLASVCNQYGEIESDEARQLIANALGCYITADLNAIELKNANDIQYKPIDTHLTRYDQIQSSLESKPKVGKIVVDKGNNTLSADYVDLTYGSTVNIVDGRTTNLEYVLPSGMTSFGKTALVDAQSTNPDSTVTLYDSVTEFYIDDNGLAHVGLPFTSDFSTPANPIVRFYKVNSDTLQETETLDNDAGEIYQNSNSLVTNSYVAGKVKRVAHLTSDISNQYEVDVIQDLRLEVGDVIRLETKPSVYKTCVITGLKFNLPGCHGHLTCRKIFSLLDSENTVDEPVGLPVSFGLTSILITEASEVSAAVGIMNKGATSYIFVLGVEKFDKTISGTTTHEDYNGSLTDLNGHEWKFACFSVPSSTEITTTARKITLPDYDFSTGASENAFGAISLLKALYDEQGMSAPVDYTCDWSE